MGGTCGFRLSFLWADWVRYLRKRSVGICGCGKVHIIKKIRKCVIYFMEYVSNIMRMCELWQQKCLNFPAFCGKLFEYTLEAWYNIKKKRFLDETFIVSYLL